MRLASVPVHAAPTKNVALKTTDPLGMVGMVGMVGMDLAMVVKSVAALIKQRRVKAPMAQRLQLTII
jgi:hypothetical protein